MNFHVRLALVLLVLGATVIAGVKAFLPLWEEWQDKSVSDARATKGQIRIGTDNWIGYFPLCSAEMKRRLRQAGYILSCEDDGADYAGRMRALAEKRIDLAAATVDSFVLNGRAQGYPGVMVAVLDESKGGDALVAWRDRIGSLDDLRRSDDLRIAFTPASPSEHLLRALSVHFDIAPLRRNGAWKVPAQGSPDALERLRKREVEAAVLWEPDVSRALNIDGVHRLLGTEQSRQLIVDVLIAGHELVRGRPEIVDTLLREYFRTLKHYRDHPDEFSRQVRDSAGLNADDVEKLLDGVSWQTLAENAGRWFGVDTGQSRREEALLDTVDDTVAILIESGAVTANPVPSGDPSRLTNSRFVAEAFARLSRETPAAEGQTAETAGFRPLTPQQWGQLREVGTLKIEAISFASGSDQLAYADKLHLDETADYLRHYPRFRIAIRGHTGLRGDPEANRALSQDRADAVARYLNVTHRIPEERMHPVGYGSERPLPRLPGESERAYGYRLPRVELVLLEDSL
jgi:outer membrane protein OmpA-like peptidoglycan-associated protein/ABC-type nitrate/sulfonate/bicarbonate transport system substrate-binding protein